MPQPSCMCTVLLKLAKVERLKSRKFWVHVLIIIVIISIRQSGNPAPMCCVTCFTGFFVMLDFESEIKRMP